MLVWQIHFSRLFTWESLSVFFLDFKPLFLLFLKYSFIEQSFLNLNQKKKWNLVQSLGRYAQFNEQMNRNPLKDMSTNTSNGYISA